MDTAPVPFGAVGRFVFFNGVAIKELPPLTIVLLQVALAAIILIVVIRATGLEIPTDRRVWTAFVGMGLLNNALPFGLIVWGQSHIASGLASILNLTTPLATVLVAHVVTDDERMTGNRLAGVILGLVGVVLMIGPETLKGFGVNVSRRNSHVSRRRRPTHSPGCSDGASSASASHR